MSYALQKPVTGFLCISPVGNSSLFKAPCRRCAPCRSYDEYIWTARSVCEIFAHPNVVLLTLTLRPGFPLDDAKAYPEVQKYLKRIRKHGHRIRFFAAPELGDARGRLHYHLLLLSNGPLATRAIRRQWKQGFTHARTIRRNGKFSGKFPVRKAARYVAKYAAKQGGRKRASSAYGLFGARHIFLERMQANAALKQIQEHFPRARVSAVRLGGTRIPRKLLLALGLVTKGTNLLPAISGTGGGFALTRSERAFIGPAPILRGLGKYTQQGVLDALRSEAMIDG